MPTPLLALIADRIRRDGPITVAEYVEIALYHPEHGYYSSAARRSGRGGDFFTSVDLGPLFGELLASQAAEMLGLLGDPPFDLVEAAAGNGRLSRDILDHLQLVAPGRCAATRLHLVERSPEARAAQQAALGRHAARLAASVPSLEGLGPIRGIVLANELLDALPPHLVVMREGGLREVRVALGPDGALTTMEAPPSSPELQAHLERAGARLEPGWFAEVNLAATRWIRQVAALLERGFLLLLDYGCEAADLYSARRAGGTLTAFRRHASEARAAGPAWLRDPGERDITSHVDLTSVRRAAEAAGLDTLGIVDQSYFLLALAAQAGNTAPAGDPPPLRRRLALKTLVLPGGMGSTHKAIVFGRGVGRPLLAGLRGGGRLT